MSVATIRTQVKTTLDAIAGVANVYEEDETTFEEVTRIEGDRVNFWHVRVTTRPTEHGIGFLEMVRDVRIEGFIGMSRDEPGDGVVSDITAGNLLDLVTSTFASATNRTLSGTVLDANNYRPEPITTVAQQIGDQTHPCHRLALTFTTYEDA